MAGSTTAAQRRLRLRAAALVALIGAAAVAVNILFGAATEQFGGALIVAMTLALAATLALLVLAGRLEGAEDYAGPRFWSGHAPALGVSLLATPLLVALLGLALIWIPLAGFVLIFSVLFGAPSFFLVGAPVAWFALKRWYTPGGRHWLIGLGVGLAANVIAGALAIPVLALVGDRDPVDTSLSIHAFGLACAPIYGAIAAQLYGLIRDPAARRASAVTERPDAAPPA